MSTNQLISIGLYTVLGIGTACAAYGWMQARTFVATITSIDCQRDLDEFKRVVKTSMYLALAMVALAVIALGLGASGMALGAVSWIEVRLILYIMAPLCGIAGAGLTSAEGRMKNVLITDNSLRTEYDAVVKRWKSSPFPNW
jgi:hypothetical protein